MNIAKLSDLNRVERKERDSCHCSQFSSAVFDPVGGFKLKESCVTGWVGYLRFVQAFL
ncbi:hypothetical protein T11_1732 [Trichinella zimbabwensis]|uniref:Uncharacterized protein n=1 Tax=Trichinella zimbabwensis TaxID=268475 RepID=A0A0V1GML6_9BILA|nr:hypothetical protein T11_1732 [Trichinella zimbabwensis]